MQDIKIIRKERHPNYNKRDGTNDIAVIYLERDVDISSKSKILVKNTCLKTKMYEFLLILVRVRPVCVPVDEPIRSRNFDGYQPFVAGWGRLQEGGKSSNILQELQLPILPNSECKEQYRKQGKLISEVQFGDAVICAGVLSGGQDSCQGDSGGKNHII